MSWMGLAFGAVVGLSLGLTGGGGAIFAVPLLVYGLHLPAQQAVGISLAAVGATALVGFLQRVRQGQVDIRTGLMFAVAGMLGAPVGTWLAAMVPETLLMLLFAGLMLVVAARMWQSARQVAQPECVAEGKGSSCQRDDEGGLVFTSRCAAVLLLAGMASGVLAGLFGVGGGFIIVPALVLVSRMPVHKAIGTSLLVIALVSVSGVTSHLLAGRDISLLVTALFIAGGIAGLEVGQHLAGKLPAPALQRVFVVAILLVATFVIVRNVSV